MFALLMAFSKCFDTPVVFGRTDFTCGKQHYDLGNGILSFSVLVVLVVPFIQTIFVLRLNISDHLNQLQRQ